MSKYTKALQHPIHEIPKILRYAPKLNPQTNNGSITYPIIAFILKPSRSRHTPSALLVDHRTFIIVLLREARALDRFDTKILLPNDCILVCQRPISVLTPQPAS